MKKKTAKTKVARTRNAGTMTESAFWSMIRAALRQKSRWWKPISKAKQKCRKPCKNCGRQKWEYQCNYCKKWFPDKKINVDHIIPAGTLKCSMDLPGFVERLFCEVSGLQVLCHECHDKKTKSEKNGK